MGKSVFLHIGMAKCASTTIQSALKNIESIDFSGFCPGEEKGYWKNKALAALFDREMRFSCSREALYRNGLNDFIKTSKKEKIVFSSENITIRYLAWDLPTHVKLSYVKKIFPQNTQYIYVYKNPSDIFISLYKEWLLLGYRKSFAEFCEDSYSFKDISFLNDLCIGHFLEIFDRTIGLDRLMICFLDKQNVWDKLSKVFGEEIVAPNENRNLSITDSQVEIIRAYNCTSNDFCSFFDSIELHRSFAELSDDEVKYSTARKRRIRKAVAEKMITEIFPAEKNIFYKDNKILDYFINDMENAAIYQNKISLNESCLDDYIMDLSTKRHNYATSFCKEGCGLK